ncbi:ligand-binding sensor domain-containing protein [Aridibaculum aurantiacum]|uniref:ligand-binding sensor domain-containing protein n=1 Tax=Aridibaculum aurantiacum TaxID=2810307 RepID=UPI001A974B31|nr:sensor histidine kinase [Aridibaculum aurantiacum]
MWVGTEAGLYKYDPKSESFHLLDVKINFTVNQLVVDQEENLWLTSGLTLYKYSFNKKTLTPYAPQQYFEATAICTAPGGTLWVSTSNGYLARYERATNSFTTFDLFPNSKATYKWIQKIKATGNGEILVGTGNAGVKVFDTRRLSHYNLDLNITNSVDLFVRDFLETSTNELWIGTEAGIFIYNRQTKSTVNLKKRYNDPYTISDNAIYTFCRDKEGGIWAGTYFGGINYYPSPFTPFKKDIPRIGENSLSGNVIREITEDKFGNLWIGTEDAGLNKLDKVTGKYINYTASGASDALSYSNIHGLLATGNELWIGTFEHGLDILDIRTGKVVRHYGASAGSSLKSNFIYTIYQAPGGEIMIGTTIGIYVYNAAKKDFEAMPGMPLYNWYTSIVKDANGIIWSGTYGNGINYYDSKTGHTGNFRFSATDGNSLSSDRVNSIFEDKDHALWFATEDGLCKWNPAKKNFNRYTTDNGLPSNFIISILQDDDKKLWISTTKGLVSFDPSVEKIQVFTSANGLISDQFNFSSAYKDAGGRMYFGSAKGMISFHPREFRHNTYDPPVYITGFQVNHKDLAVEAEQSPLKSAISFTEKIKLDYDQSTFSIDFAALSFTAPEMLEYAYKLQGLNNDWTYLKTNRKVYFTKLAPGRYTFMVRARNSSGVWSKDDTRLVIEVLPPWWANNWAYAAYALAILTIIFYLLYSYHKTTEEKNRRKIELLEIAKEKEIFTAKIDFFTNVAHEIRTPLTLIKGPLKKVIRIAGGIEELQKSLSIMERNTDRLVDLTNQLLDFRQTEINGFGLSFVHYNINELLHDAFQSFTELAEEKDLQFNIHLPAEPVYAYIDAEGMNKIVYNLYGNAVKYACSKIDVRLFPHPTDEAYFVVQVANDGYIIPPELKDKVFEPFFRIKETDHIKGTGIGLALSRTLAQLHKGELVLEDPQDGMNIFQMVLPYHQQIEFNLSADKKIRKRADETEHIGS